MATRSADSRLSILLESPGQEHLSINGTRLPTHNQVLLCHLSHIEKFRSKDNTRQNNCSVPSARATFEQVKIHYIKANIEMLSEHQCISKITHLHNEYLKLKKISSSKRTSHPRITEFKEKLHQSMPFWPKNIIQQMEQSKRDKLTVETVTIEEDISFMKSMMSNREAHYSGCDKVTSSIINRRQFKSMQEKICVLKEKKRKSDQFLAYTDSYECEEESDSDFLPITPSRSHKRIVKTGTNLHVPHDVLKSPIIVSALTRNKITPTKASSLLTAIISACDGDPSKVSLNYTTAYQYSVEVHNTIAQKIKSDWEPPGIGLLHWDGKLMETLDGASKEERLPVLLSGIGGTKLLGVPAIQSTNSEPMGKQIALHTVALLVEWNCKDSVCGMVFDTTSTNTGK